MALPLISALASLGIAIGLIELLSHVMKMPQFASELTMLIGLGVGVDYALFIVTRHRQGLIAGHDNEESIVNAVNTSGRAVLFAGIIVCIALLGMFALGVSFLYGLAVSASLGVLLTMFAALTLLPALLGFIGPRVLSRRQRRNLKANGPASSVQAAAASGLAGPTSSIAVPPRPHSSLSPIIILIALPFFSLQLGSSDQGNDPAGTTTRQAYDMLSSGFGPGFNGPLQLVAEIKSPAEKSRVHSRRRRSLEAVRRCRSAAAHVHPRKERRRGRARRRLPDDLTAGERHDQSRRTTTQHGRPAGRGRFEAHRAGRRIDRDLH